MNPLNLKKSFIDDFFFVPPSTLDYPALVRMFGEPNLKCKIGEIESNVTDFGTTHFQDIKCSWESKNVLLIFSGRRFYNASRVVFSNNGWRYIIDEFEDGAPTKYEAIFQKRSLTYSYNLAIKNIEDSIANSNRIIEKAQEETEKEEFIKGF